jgi:hypothetical protein
VACDPRLRGHDGSEQARAIEGAIEFTYETTRADDYLDEDFRESIEDAMAAWQRLKHDAGFDLQGVFIPTGQKPD